MTTTDDHHDHHDNHHDNIPIGSDEELTAYALGDHDVLPPDRRAAIESRLAQEHTQEQDGVARSQIENDQQTATALTDAFADESESSATDAHLSDAQRHAITAMANANNPTPWYRSRPLIGSIAAMLIIGIGVGFALPQLGATRRTARQIDGYAYADGDRTPQSRANVENKSRDDTLHNYALAMPVEKNEHRESQIKSQVEPLVESLVEFESNQSPVGQTSRGLTYVTDVAAVADVARNAGVAGGKAIIDNLGIGTDEKKSLNKPATTSQSVVILGDNFDRTYQPASLPANQPAYEPANRLSTRQAENYGLQKQRGLSFSARGITGNDIRMPIEPARANAETYDAIIDNAFTTVTTQPLSTFSIDVDTASYANVRRFLTQGQRPPRNAVRIEEMVNYFDYQLTTPADHSTPFNTQVEVATCPWQPDHRLVKIGVKGYEIPIENRPAANIVFLIDVSGSMSSPDKLPLLKTGFRMLVDQLREGDRVAIVVYAGSSGLVLDSTDASDKQTILASLDRLNAGGSTNGGAGIQLAYDIATKQFVTGGINRVILATDGDFNVGITNRQALVNLVKQRAASNVYLTILGFGQGNLKDATMEQLTNHGDGTYAYIDSLREAQRVLVDQVGSTLHTIAKDVKIQVEFNPKQVASYRLIGYENRILAKEDFNNDTVDAGDIGAGHSVVALYEVVPTGIAVNPTIPTQPMRYQQPQTQSETELVAQNTVPNGEHTHEMLAVNIRYKAPDAPKIQGTSKLLVFPVHDSEQSFEQASDDFKFAAAVAGFGMLLRDSPHLGSTSLDNIETWAKHGIAQTHPGIATQQSDRLEFITLVQHARSIFNTP